ncbi:excinuclease ABC subunit UvrA [Candidatus Roizmanbacteria bacterium CG_4_10_14_0_8_um_filter_39_9]|uniref:UvrABC system protein A n=1 Tax=Candidatus Roizmanbacteria bacterium CG_4_10_14_0_8_um_filter_39_9 TaxID=1974829 RepID=A0A2M7QCD0_9BACT|nr:MAG: excinuclease ABC subunit UvrA [Candidatus Roizmanbacteria bacterium CG_4_10_14_0_8_um_filter_39_9]
MNDTIKVRGARQHNLKNISVDIPKNKLVVITGVSGSGKSSLAFDTIYAEGQRRYVESLSAYARQFLGVMDKPDVDMIEGLSPSISIDQKTTSHNPRSTVGTITEIYDYLRLLFARVGHPHCPDCKVEIKKMSLDEIVDRVQNTIEIQVTSDKMKPHEFNIMAPIVRGKKGEFKDLFENIKIKGYIKLRVDNVMFDTTGDEINLLKTNKHSIEVLIDSIYISKKDLKNEVFASNLHSRLTTSLEQALNLADGLVILKGDKEKLFSEKLSCPKCGLSISELEPRMFSFNSPLGACVSCKGLGTVFKVDPDLILNENLTINEGGILPFNKMFFQNTWYIRLLKTMAGEEGIDLNTKIKDLGHDKREILLKGTGGVYRVPGQNRFGKDTVIFEKWSGLLAEFERRFFESQSPTEEYDIHRYVREELCNSCKGDRLKPEILAITIGGHNIIHTSKWAINSYLPYIQEEIHKVLSPYERTIAKLILKEITARLLFLRNVGLGYLTVDRPAKSLSGGELQRIRLASQIGSGLTGVLYVLDEPSIGLHPKDVAALIESLKNLRNLGNSVLLVEHDVETIENADYIVELGPRAGKNGGKIVAEGTLTELKKNKNSLTGTYLTGERSVSFPKRETITTKGHVELQGATQFNLKDIAIKLPLGNLIAITGVSGSGKSTLIVETLYPALKYYLDGYFTDKIGDFKRLLGHQYLERVFLVDQSPIGRTPRSNPATYLGIFDEIRDIFAETMEAKAKGFKKGRFSFNVKGGRCEKCQGAGVNKIQMQFLPDVYVTCDVCEGRRYNKETLEILFKGKTIFDILNMTVDETYPFFQNHFKIAQKLAFLRNVGLGYISAGQPAPTFSGGEAQRIKLANELSRRDTGKTMYILDEPTTGLHSYDVEKLLQTLYQLVDGGNTVVIIEHNMDVIKNCQYIVDLGPDGGDEGGEIIYQGDIHGIMKVGKSYTGQYLKRNDK